MSESEMRSRVITALRPFHAVAIENSCARGTPDVNCALGWIELKRLGQWPKLGGAVRIAHFTAYQRLWLQKRWRHWPGGSWLLLQVKREWLLFKGCDVSDIGTLTRQELISLAHWYAPAFDAKALIAQLKAV